MIEVINNSGVGACMLLEDFPERKYTLLRRQSKFEPYVAAWNFDRESGSWGQGHYFQKLSDAMLHILME